MVVEEVIKIRIEQINSRRLTLRGEPQPPIPHNVIYRLEYNGSYLELRNLETKKIKKMSDGEIEMYDFIISVYDPSHIYCFNKEEVPHIPDSGHTSMAAAVVINVIYTEKIPPDWLDVYFAGTMYIEAGRILRWNNHSGHYRPGPDAYDINIPAPLKLILKPGLYW